MNNILKNNTFINYKNYNWELELEDFKVKQKKHVVFAHLLFIKEIEKLTRDIIIIFEYEKIWKLDVNVRSDFLNKMNIDEDLFKKSILNLYIEMISLDEKEYKVQWKELKNSEEMRNFLEIIKVSNNQPRDKENLRKNKP